jgi:hypothetical protein
MIYQTNGCQVNVSLGFIAVTAPGLTIGMSRFTYGGFLGSKLPVTPTSRETAFIKVLSTLNLACHACVQEFARHTQLIFTLPETGLPQNPLNTCYTKYLLTLRQIVPI